MLKKIQNCKPRKKKGQSTVEYILLVAAVLGVLVVFLRPGGVLTTAFNKAITTGSTGMTTLATRLGNSHTPSPK